MTSLPKTSQHFPSMLADAERIIRETQALIENIRQLNEADARFACALAQIGMQRGTAKPA